MQKLEKRTKIQQLLKEKMVVDKTQFDKYRKCSELDAEKRNEISLYQILRIKRRKKFRRTKFKNLYVEKHRKRITLRKKNRTERKKIKSPAVNSGLAPLRVLRIFGKLLAKPKFVYICEVP